MPAIIFLLLCLCTETSDILKAKSSYLQDSGLVLWKGVKEIILGGLTPDPPLTDSTSPA